MIEDREMLRSVKKIGLLVVYLIFMNSFVYAEKLESFIYLCKEGVLNISKIDDSYKRNKETTLVLVEQNSTALIFVERLFLLDKAFMKCAIKRNAHVITYASSDLQNDRELAIYAVNQEADVFINLVEKFQRDKSIAFLAIKKINYIFSLLDDALKEDKEFVAKLFKADIDVRTYLSDNLKNDKELLALSLKIERKYEFLEELFVVLAIFVFIIFIYKEEKKVYLLILTILLLFFSWFFRIYFAHGVFRVPLVVVSKTHQYGLEPIKCWLGGEAGNNVECYNVHVPEIHGDKKSRTITFPLRVFRTSEVFSFKSPVLHLGGGGPGGAMYFNYKGVTEDMLNDFDEVSIKQGRDLFLVDPRGSGLSVPMLNCRTYADNFLTNLQTEPSIDESFKMMENDYGQCVKKFKAEKVDFKSYNSIAFADDIEMLRGFVNVEKWILFGVSYSTTYAMHVNKKYPKTVEKMILDSACFPNIKELRHYIISSEETFNLFYNYEYNSTKKMNVKKRMWDLFKQLNENAIPSNYDINVNGNIFIDTLLWGAYGREIFEKLPKIFDELENHKIDSLEPFLRNYLNFMTDIEYGDISSLTHYCYEDKPFIDFKKFDEQIKKLPEGYLQVVARKAIETNKFCKEMNIKGGDKDLNASIKTDIPTLFIHGKLDTITPLKDVLEQMKGFSNSRVLTYDKSHSVMEDGKIESDVASFLIE